MSRYLAAVGVALVGLATPVGLGQDRQEKTWRYLRPAAKGFVLEARFTLRQEKSGWTIASVTGRGDTTMTISARYDAEDRLMGAEATLAIKEKKTPLAVDITEGKAQVRRKDQPLQEFDVPPGTIVTSAPDWTDIFLLCRRYDGKKGGKQEFPGLWIHPQQPAQRLTFTIERLGQDVVDHKDQRLTLNRFRIRIRGPSAYLAWADSQGVLVKLLPLPVKEGVPAGFVLEGYEKTAATLRPGPKSP